MLFNSYIFLYLFFPIVFSVYYILLRKSMDLSIAWLLAASLLFYGWWDWHFVPLLLGSIIFNYSSGFAISKLPTYKNKLLFASLAINIGLLFWYKYSNFFIHTIGNIFGMESYHLDIILPLGISFFTFTQIAFLVDVWRGDVREYNFIHYALFVTYFPHLIAGPVLHHKEMMPQFKASSYRFNLADINIGLVIFFIGLFKKVILADGIQPYVAPVFDVNSDAPISFDEAWAGAIAYTFQLYFDFSGYSDMAIGLSRMFGIVLPLNFASPYKAINAIEFWRRWHMTLSRFLRDYLYIPLGGNRKGGFRRYLNLTTTMLLGGLWHGASWTFVAWGGLHGFYLVVNHAWQHTWKIQKNTPISPLGRISGIFITFISVVVAWVLFRSTSFDAATRVLAAMFGGSGLSLPAEWLGALGFVGDAVRQIGVDANTHHVYSDGLTVWTWISIGFLIVWGLPNSQQFVATKHFTNYLTNPFQGKWPSPFDRQALLIGWLIAWIFVLSAISGSLKISEFIYFNF